MQIGNTDKILIALNSTFCTLGTTQNTLVCTYTETLEQKLWHLQCCTQFLISWVLRRDSWTETGTCTAVQRLYYHFCFSVVVVVVVVVVVNQNHSLMHVFIYLFLFLFMTREPQQMEIETKDCKKEKTVSLLYCADLLV